MNKILFITLFSLPTMMFACCGAGGCSANSNMAGAAKVETVGQTAQPNTMGQADPSAVNQPSTTSSAFQQFFAKPETATANDADLRNLLRDRLTNSQFGQRLQNLDIDVNNGVVTLKGAVLTQQEKQDILERLREFPQIRQIIDQIQVQQQANQQNMPQSTTY